MANEYYQSAFKSDIFYQKRQSKHLPPERTLFSHTHQPKDNVSSLSSYMQTEPIYISQHHKKFFSSKQSDVLNVYAKNAPLRRRELGPRHHLSKSQVEMGNDDHSSFRVRKNKKLTVGRYPQQSSPYQRKMEEFYGKDYASKLGHADQPSTTRNALQNDLYDDSINYKSLDNNCSAPGFLLKSPPCKGDRNRLPHKQIKVRVRDGNNKGSHPFERKVNFLKSNIFNDPDIDRINSYHNIPHKEKKLDTHPIKTTKRANSVEMGMIFDWRDSNNEIWLSKYSKDKCNYSAKERKLNEIYGSLSQIAPESTKGSQLGKFFEGKAEIESTAKAHYQGKGTDAIQKQCENMSSLNGSDFYQTSYRLNSKASDAKGDVVHSYEIPNINESDIRQVKRYFTTNGIHVYDTALHDFKMNSPEPGRISVKIRENVHDENFNKNLTKAQEELKKGTGLELKVRLKPTKSYTHSIPQTLMWNDANLDQFVKNRYEESKEQRTHIKGYGTNRKDKVTTIPYDLGYKNTLCKKH